MDLGHAVQIGSLVWPVSEIILARATRARRAGAELRDRGSLVILWTVITAGIFAGAVVRVISGTTGLLPRQWAAVAGLILLVVGLSIRWMAITTLGRFFTPTVAIHRGHRLVRTGLYRTIRHPSYTGLLLAFAGLAFTFGNWLSLLVVVVPVTAAVLYRIQVEEGALARALGQEYIDYCKSTKRLVPGLY